jgi:Uma2 family endonuclease
MSTSTLPKTVTYQEWLEMPVIEDRSEEVVAGEIRIIPPNKWIHSEVVDSLAELLRGGLRSKDIRVKASGFGLVVRREPLTCRVPDLVVMRRSTMILEEGYVHSAPDLVVEVLSPSNTRHEMDEKIRDYESIGVPELWILSPEARTFEILSLVEGKLERTQVLAEGQIHPQRFPEALVDVDSVWPD